MSATATLYINRSDSQCGACGRNADPYEKRHDSIWAWAGTLPGCHAEFTEVSSHYSDHDGLYDRIREMRPDLPFVDYLAAVNR